MYEIRKRIEEKFKSVSNFAEQMHETIGISKMNAYYIANYKSKNPGVLTLSKIAMIIGMPMQEATQDYIETYNANHQEEQNNGKE